MASQGILDLEALLKVPNVDPYDGYDLSPDGKQVAFSWNPTGRWEIYMIVCRQRFWEKIPLSYSSTQNSLAFRSDSMNDF